MRIQRFSDSLNDSDLNHVDFNEADLSGAVLTHSDLSDAELSEANLRFAQLSLAKLHRAMLTEADLSYARVNATWLDNADLTKASLLETNLYSAVLHNASLIKSNLSSADLRNASLQDANLTAAMLHATNLRGTHLDNTLFDQVTAGRTIFDNLDLRKARSLENVNHGGPSEISISTIYRSQGKIPEVFLRGCGVPESLIVQIPALVAALEPIQFYSCFISYSSKDQDFADRLYADLQARGVRCWFAPEDLKIGAEIRTGRD